ncbi:FtsX-like permease family protein [Microvirga sp. W0021]|uniref:FtsX-like permease family protein n=1 Tax=Hohaiivirga grylli TaxID=3133970 RepID=A0ABV0BH83_9HYPH
MAAVNMRWRLLYRALSRRNQRLIVVFLALMTGAAIINSLASVYFDINIKMSRELRTFGANFYIGPTVSQEMPISAFNDVMANAPDNLIETGSPYLFGTARSELEKVVLVGVNFSAIGLLVPYWQVEGDWISVDFDNRNAMIGRTLANRLNIKLGDTLNLVKDRERKALKIKGIIDAGDASDNMVFVNLDLAQEWLEKPDTMSHALFSMNNMEGEVENYAHDLKEKHPEWTVRPIRKVSSNEGEVLSKIQGLMGLVSVIILLLSTLCVNTSLTAIIRERQKEFALQKSLGASNRSIITQVLSETVVIAVLATLAGCILGIFLAQILGQTVFSSSITPRLVVVPITFAMSLFAALVAAIIPLRRIVQIQPAVVLKGE